MQITRPLRLVAATLATLACLAVGIPGASAQPISSDSPTTTSPAAAADVAMPSDAVDPGALAAHNAALSDQAAAIAKADEDLKAAAAAKAAEEEAARKAAGYDPSVTDPKEIARQLMANQYGWGDDQFTCFNNIIMRESMWSVTATNPSSGAYGIPQALPGSKMAQFGDDWRTNPVTQIKWALWYLQTRYGTPCGGWAFKSAHGWY